MADKHKRKKIEYYKKRKGSATMKGELFEISVASHLFLYATQHMESFRLASNVDYAGAFDDLVFSYKYRLSDPERTLFLQLKHKDNKGVMKTALLASKGDFSLVTYFLAYLETKKHSGKTTENFHFAIYTNAPMDSSIAPCEHDNFLNTGDGKVYSFNEKSEEYSAFENVEKYRNTLLEFVNGQKTAKDLEPFMNFAPCCKLMKLVDNNEEFKEEMEKQLREQWNWETWREFLQKMKFYAKQMCVDNFPVILKDQLRTILGASEERNKDIYRKFWPGITEWWSKNFYLTERHAPFWMEIVEAQKSELTGSEPEALSKLKFEKMHNEEDSERVIHCVCQGCTKLCCLRIQQSLGNVFIVSLSTLEERLEEVLCIWRNVKCYSTLVLDGEINKKSAEEVNETEETEMEVDNEPNHQELDGRINKQYDIIRKLSEVLKSDSSKKLIVVAGFKDYIARKLFNLLPAKKKICSFNLTQLTKESQNSVLKTNVEFQGQTVELQTLVSDLKQLTADIVVDFLERTPDIKVGVRLPVIGHAYIPRELVRGETISREFISTDEEDCIAVSGASLAEIESPETSVLQFSSSQTLNTNCKRYLIDGPGCFAELCKHFEKVHWIKKSGDSFIWQNSKGGIDLIKQSLDNRAVLLKKYSRFSEILEIPHLIIPIVAQPGMGKSTELEKLASDLKTQDPSRWVVLVKLSDHSHILNEEIPSAEDLLCTAGSFKEGSDKALFLHQLNDGGNVVVLLDGFDEVSPKYSQKMMALIDEIALKKVRKIFVTSRPSMTQLLENHFSCLSFTLLPFSREDQINFLLEFWNIQDIGGYDLKYFASKILKLTSTSLLKHTREFTEIPLQIKMLSEVFETDAKEYSRSGKDAVPKALDLLQLYSKFIDQKWNKKCERDMVDLARASVSNSYEELKELFLEKHMMYAFVSIMDKDEMKKFSHYRCLLKRYERFLRRIKAGKEDTGLVIDVTMNKPNFIHRTFAEYFFALLLSENHQENRDFIKDILLRDDFQMVKVFFDRMICQGYELHTAVLNQDLSSIKKLVTSDSGLVNLRDNGGRTPLHLSVKFLREFQIDAMKILLENGANPNARDYVFGWTPLRMADEIKCWPAVELLLEHKASADDLVLIRRCIDDPDQLRELLKSCTRRGLVNIVNFMLDEGVYVDCPLKISSDYGYAMTMLIWAAKHGRHTLVKRFVELGANLEERDGQYQRTSFLWAARGGHLEVVEFLMEKRVRTDVKDRYDCTALILAAASGNEDLVSYLEPYSELNARNQIRQTAVLIAAKNKKWRVVTFLQERGAAMDCCDDALNNVLHYAARHGFKGIEEFVGISNLDINSQNLKGETPVLTAAAHKKFELVRILSRLGADLAVKDNCGNTVLHYAVQAGETNLNSLFPSSEEKS